jgi:hypothetical protein
MIIQEYFVVDHGESPISDQLLFCAQTRFDGFVNVREASRRYSIPGIIGNYLNLAVLEIKTVLSNGTMLVIKLAGYLHITLIAAKQIDEFPTCRPKYDAILSLCTVLAITRDQFLMEISDLLRTLRFCLQHSRR